jgi:hydrogenase expression/formation protein HypC
MCLAVPLQVTSIDGTSAVVQQDGATLRVRTDLLDQVSVGDYVLVHAGFAIERLQEDEALATLALLAELADAPD